MRVIHERRSVRAFHDKDIPDELLAKILAAGLNAAHSRN
ncbi:MAG: nitroreductase family protein, partial [Firmicutes bacterium]|nr:nitroreductase family protein [Bacillota bacterium]